MTNMNTNMHTYHTNLITYYQANFYKVSNMNTNMHTCHINLITYYQVHFYKVTNNALDNLTK